MRKILKNRCQCRQCGDIIESTHRHDWVQCSCGAIYTDGGREYIQRGYRTPEDLIDLTEFSETDDTSGEDGTDG